MTASDLHRNIKTICGTKKKKLPKYRYPQNVLMTHTVDSMVREGIDIEIRRDQCHFISKLRSQIPAKKTIFGGGYLVSDSVAVELAAKINAAKTEEIEWPLDEQERLVIASLR